MEALAHDTSHWNLEDWVQEHMAIRLASRRLDAEAIFEMPDLDAEPGIMPRLISQPANKLLFRAFGQRGMHFFDLYYQLYRMWKGQPVPAEGLVRPFQAAVRMVFQRLVVEETKNLIQDQQSTIRMLLQRVETGRAVDNTWRQLAAIYGDLIVEVAQDRNVFLKARILPDMPKWRFYRKMSPRESKFQSLKREDPVMYQSIMEAREKLKELDRAIEKEILDNGMVPSKKYLMGRPVMIGTDPATGEQFVFDTDQDLLSIPDYFAKHRKGDRSKRRLTQTFPQDLSKLRSMDEEDIELFYELRKLELETREDLGELSDDEIEALAKGDVEYLALTDDKAKQNPLTRIYPVQEIDGVKVVVGGRFRGIAIDDLVSAAGRMIEGVAYDYDPRRGVPTPIETKNADGLPNLRVTREPYVTLSHTGQLYLRMPNSHDFKKMRGDIFELASLVPSLQMVPGSRRQGWLFPPSDFSAVRDALGGLALSKGAADLLEDYFMGLARHELATKAENLKHFSLSRIGGFRSEFRGKPLDLWTKQREAFAWLSSRGDSGVCALDTGVGKTPIAIAVVQKMRRDGKDQEGNGRFLYVCPSSLKGNFPSKARFWLTDPDPFLDQVDVVSHDEFAKNRRADEDYGKDYVAILVDEAHITVRPTSSGGFSNPAKALMSLDHPRKVLLTASPMERDPMQLFMLASISNNTDLDSREGRAQARAFKRRYCEVIGIKKDPRTQRDFRQWVKQHVFFADKRDVEEIGLPQLLPEAERLVMDPEIEDAYRETTSKIARALRGMVLKYRDRDPKGRDPVTKVRVDAKEIEAARVKFRALFSRLNELSLMPDLVIPGARNPKLDRSVEILDERIANGRRTLLFTDSPKMAEHTGKTLSRRIPGLLHAVAFSSYIDVYRNGELATYEVELKSGRMKTKNMRFRKRAYTDADGNVWKVDDWKTYVLRHLIGGNPRVASLTLTSGYAVGQNLQMFDTVIHLDRDSWNNETMKQRTARAWRSGQKNSVSEINLDTVYSEQRDKLDATLDEIRRYMQELEGDLFDQIVIESQSESLGKEWFEMRQMDASFYELNRRMMEIALSPYLARLGEEEM